MKELEKEILTLVNERYPLHFINIKQGGICCSL